MREESCIVLHKAQGTGGPRARFQGKASAKRDKIQVGTANGKVQEANRVEYRLSDAAERIANGFCSQLGCLGAIGVPPHAIDGEEQNRPFPCQNLDTILIFVTITDQAQICVFDAQGHSN
jgi:hypothetical protein